MHITALGKVIVGLTLLTATTGFAQEAADSSEAQQESVAENVLDTVGEHVSGSVGFAVGSTSNAGLLSAARQGTYGKFSPMLTFEFEPSDNLLLLVDTLAEWQRFSSEELQDLGDETAAEARLSAIYFVGTSWELGAEAGVVYLRNRIPSLITGGVTVSTPQQYVQPGARLYAAWFGGPWTIEVGTAGKVRDYSTFLSDLQGNVYRNSYSELEGFASGTYRFTEATRLRLKLKAGQRHYRERMAAFTEGLDAFPGSPNPDSELFLHEYELVLRTAAGEARLRTEVGADFVVDRVFGAESGVKYTLQQKAEIPVLGVQVEPEITLARKDFSNFRADPVNNAVNQELRVDTEARLGTSVVAALGSGLNLNAKYQFNRFVSNYASLTYSEHVVESGVSMAF